LHSLIAGSALGAAGTFRNGLALFIAIIAHKWAESFALSITLIKHGIPLRRSLGIVVVYSIMCPLGVLISTALSVALAGEAMIMAEIIFSSFACGTFLYVALIHMMEREYTGPFAVLYGTIAQALGFSVMLTISLWV